MSKLEYRLGQAVLNEWQALLDGRTPIPADRSQFYIGNPNDAHSYYQYISGTFVLIQCARGFVFDPHLNVANFPDQVPTSANPAPRQADSILQRYIGCE